MRRLISTGSPFEKTAGYSRAVVQGDWCFVSGTTGYDYATMTMPETVEAQTHNCMATIAKALEEGGFDLADVVRAQYTVAEAAHAELVFPILGQYFGDIRPAAIPDGANVIYSTPNSFLARLPNAVDLANPADQG